MMVSAIALLILPTVLSEPIILPENRAKCKLNFMFIIYTLIPAFGYVKIIFAREERGQLESLCYKMLPIIVQFVNRKSVLMYMKVIRM